MIKLLSVKASSRCILALILVSTLMACGNNQDSPVLRIGTNVWPGYEPLYLADSLGYFAENQVHLVEYSSASQVARAFRNNLIDAATLTLDEVLLLAQYDFELEVILVMDVSQGGDVILSNPEFKDMEALKGRRIGVENNALGAFVLTRALQLAGMDITDVIVVPVEVDDHEGTYNSGNIDAVVTFEPVSSRLLNMGANQVFDSRQIPGEIVDVLIVRRDYLKNAETTLRGLISGWYKALEYMSQHRADAMRRISERLHLSVDDTSRAYEGLELPDKNENRRLLLGEKAVLLDSTRKLLKIMTKRKLIQHSVEPQSLFQYVQNNQTLHD